MFAALKTITTKRTPELEESKPQKNPSLYNNSPTAFVYNGYPPVYYPVMTQTVATQEAAQYSVLSAENAPFPMDYSSHYSTRIAAK